MMTELISVMGHLWVQLNDCDFDDRRHFVIVQMFDSQRCVSRW
jgi:hypothetical protein